MATTPSPTSRRVGRHRPTLKDTATLPAGFNETGTITFTLEYNGATVDTEMATVNGNGNYTTPSGYALPDTGA